jgi:hypothetical protein
VFPQLDSVACKRAAELRMTMLVLLGHADGLSKLSR